MVPHPSVPREEGDSFREEACEDHLLESRSTRDELELQFQTERRKNRYKVAAFCLILVVVTASCSIVAFRMAWSSWGSSPEWQSFEREIELFPQERYKPVENHMLYIGILSVPKNFDQRDLARKSWVEHARNHLHGLKIEFVIGQIPLRGDRVAGGVVTTLEERNLEEKLQAEADFHKDISRVPAVESALFREDKVLWLLSNAIAWKARFVMKTTDNQRVAVKSALAALQMRTPIAPPAYFGKVKLWMESSAGMYCPNSGNVHSAVTSQKACQDKCDENCMGISYKALAGSDDNCYLCIDDNLQVLPALNFYRKPAEDSNDVWFGEPCYGISGDLAHKITATHLNNSLRLHRHGDDASMAKWIAFENGIRQRAGILPVSHVVLPNLCIDEEW